ncbi:hypothetical protein [Leuconostoc mesenteroides]|nr:hypothetical protein [Leuconostoc mesenteroides]
MSIRYSQDFKDSLVKLHQEGRSLKSLAEEMGIEQYPCIISFKI